MESITKNTELHPRKVRKILDTTLLFANPAYNAPRGFSPLWIAFITPCLAQSIRFSLKQRIQRFLHTLANNLGNMAAQLQLINRDK